MDFAACRWEGRVLVTGRCTTRQSPMPTSQIRKLEGIVAADVDSPAHAGRHADGIGIGIGIEHRVAVFPQRGQDVVEADRVTQRPTIQGKTWAPSWSSCPSRHALGSAPSGGKSQQQSGRYPSRAGPPSRRQLFRRGGHIELGVIL